jgi:hypothetical protein
VPIYHKHRVFIRLQHKSSLDYNPSVPALTNDEECWIYYADRSIIIDSQLNVLSLSFSIILYYIIDSVAAIFHETNVGVEIYIDQFAIFCFY